MSNTLWALNLHIHWDYPPLRCCCAPGLRCGACRSYTLPRQVDMAPPAPSYPQGLAHSLTTGERRRARRSEEEKRAAVRLTLGAWIQAHGRLPLSADFRVGTSWNLETPLGRMGHHQVYRLYGSLDALWQDCYEQGLCTRRQWQAAREHKGKAIRTNGAKGRAAQRQKVSTS